MRDKLDKEIYEFCKPLFLRRNRPEAISLYFVNDADFLGIDTECVQFYTTDKDWKVIKAGKKLSKQIDGFAETIKDEFQKWFSPTNEYKNVCVIIEKSGAVSYSSM
jgi:hypothetical protein